MSKLPSLDSEYKITDEQIASYQRDGHILLRNVCSKEEIAAYRELINDVMLEFAKAQKELSERTTYGKAFLQKGNLWKVNEQVKQFVFAKRFAQIAAALSGSSGIRLYHDQALFKEAGGGITPWHQDQIYWPLDTSQSLTMWMPMIDVSEEMGTLDFASKSHKKGYLGDIAISDESEVHFRKYIKEKGYSIFKSGAMQAGDATFHNGWTLHAANSNQSQTLREVMTVIYYPDNTHLIKPDNNNRKFDFDAFYKGMKAGELAASDLTPLIYKK